MTRERAESAIESGVKALAYAEADVSGHEVMLVEACDDLVDELRATLKREAWLRDEYARGVTDRDPHRVGDVWRHPKSDREFTVVRALEIDNEPGVVLSDNEGFGRVGFLHSGGYRRVRRAVPEAP